MTRSLSNPLNLPSSAQPAIYRPKYRSRVDNPSYALEGTTQTQATPELPTLLSTVQALEAWQQQQLGQQKDIGVRWHPEKAGCLNIYLAPGPSEDWNTLILKATHDWEAASLGLIRFTKTVRPEAADITVSWADNPVLGREFEVGHTQRTLHSNHWLRKAAITLLTQPAIDTHLQASQIDARVYTTALHELGHALGLEHSQHKKDVMYHRGWQNPGLSPNDIHRLQTLYTQPIPTWFIL